MGLTIKMRIDEHDEHTYVFSTGDGGEIELIPLSVVANGNYSAPDGKAYNLVSVNVPLPEIKSLNITENGTFTSESGQVWNVVNVNVEPLLEAVSRTITENGTFTITPSEGYDGMNQITLNIDVPTGGGGDVVTVFKRITPTAGGSIYTIDLSAEKPQGKSLIGFIIRPASGTFQSIAQGGGRGAIVYYTAIRDIDGNTSWYKTWLYKPSTSQMTSPSGGGSRTAMNITPQENSQANVVAYDNTNEAIKVMCRTLDASTTNKYGFASYCPYELYAFYK